MVKYSKDEYDGVWVHNCNFLHLSILNKKNDW